MLIVRRNRLADTSAPDEVWCRVCGGKTRHSKGKCEVCATREKRDRELLKMWDEASGTINQT